MSNWISVKDRLPHKDERRISYLCWNGSEFFVVKFREYLSGWRFEPDYGIPTHWQPLPEAPSDE